MKAADKLALNKIQIALAELSLTADYDYYDGDHVWCRFCRANRPTPDHEDDLTWHSEDCLYRLAMEHADLLRSLAAETQP